MKIPLGRSQRRSLSFSKIRVKRHVTQCDVNRGVVIELDGITKSFRVDAHQKTISHDIDLTHRASETVAITAPSGSDEKSTLMNILGRRHPRR